MFGQVFSVTYRKFIVHAVGVPLGLEAEHEESDHVTGWRHNLLVAFHVARILEREHG